MKLSIFKVKKEKGEIYLSFNSIEEMYEMYVYLLKEKISYNDIKIIKETKDRRVSQVSGKYFSTFPKLEELISRKYENIIELPENIYLVSYDIKQYLGFHYISRKEFDHKKDGFSFVFTDWRICFNAGITGLKQIFHNCILNGWGAERFEMFCNSLEEMYDIYLYFLKLNYHTKFQKEYHKNDVISRVKFPTPQSADYYNKNYFTVTVMLNRNFNFLLKFIEDFEGLYWKMNYTFVLNPSPNMNGLYNRFESSEIYDKLVKNVNYGDII